MDIGYFGLNIGSFDNPDSMTRLLETVEGAGFESIWTGEHVVLPDPRQAPSPAEPETPMLHPPAHLAFLAGVTSTIKLGTGITLVAQRNPVVLAKEIGSLDVLCQGRLLFGIGAGYLHQEFDALGVDFPTRGARTDEYIDAMRKSAPTAELPGEWWDEIDPGLQPPEAADSWPIREAVEALPVLQARVMKLSYFEGKSHSEIAHELNIPLGSVKSNIRLAFQKIRARLRNEP